MKNFKLQLFAAEPNVITTQQFTINPREVDFVTSFGRDITALTEVLGISRPIRKANGTILTAKRATGELQNGTVAEGDICLLYTSYCYNRRHCKYKRSNQQGRAGENQDSVHGTSKHSQPWRAAY